MNLPPWATHVAVDSDGDVFAFDAEPIWSESAGVWLCRHDTGRCDAVHVGPQVARVLCAPLAARSDAPAEAAEST